MRYASRHGRGTPKAGHYQTDRRWPAGARTFSATRALPREPRRNLAQRPLARWAIARCLPRRQTRRPELSFRLNFGMFRCWWRGSACSTMSSQNHSKPSRAWRVHQRRVSRRYRHPNSLLEKSEVASSPRCFVQVLFSRVLFRAFFFASSFSRFLFPEFFFAVSFSRLSF
jgi:hypothetical protein